MYCNNKQSHSSAYAPVHATQERNEPNKTTTVTPTYVVIKSKLLSFS